MTHSVGKVVGGGLLIAGVAAVWLWPSARAPEAAPEPIRPIKSALARDVTTMQEMKFSGTIRAGRDRTLAFKQAGRIARIPVVKGQHVKKGDKLAWLLQDDFKNNLAVAEAAAHRDRLTFTRVSAALERNAVSREEVSKAEASLKQSQQQYELAKRALDETVLYAPFDAVVGDVPATELDMSVLSEPVVVLLDLSTIKVDAAVPESVVIQTRLMKDREGGSSEYVTFDSYAKKSYPVDFVECKTTAETGNQTFTVTFVLPAPPELELLPGMSATITIPADSYARAQDDEKGAEIPAAAVGVAADGAYFAWVLTPVPGEEGVYEAHRRTLGACKHVGDVIRVASGLKPGERVATAGVSMLTEGRKVRLLADKDAAK